MKIINVSNLIKGEIEAKYLNVNICTIKINYENFTSSRINIAKWRRIKLNINAIKISSRSIEKVIILNNSKWFL